MRSVPVLAGLLCSACSAAPAQNVLGSFVPSWLICALGGVGAIILFRMLFKLVGIHDQLLSAPLTYVGIGIVAALLIWLLWFGH